MNRVQPVPGRAKLTRGAGEGRTAPRCSADPPGGVSVKRASVQWRDLSTLALGAALVLGAIGCYGPYRPRIKQRIVGSGLVAEYDSTRDRLVRFGPRGYFNLLSVHNTDEDGVALDGYAYYGGMYSWVSPQTTWRDEQGDQKLWPPPAPMDTGPMRTTRHALNEFEAVGPVLESGLQEIKSVHLGRDHYGQRALVTQGLRNTADSSQWGGAWLSTAAIPGSVIAVITPTDGRTITLSDHPGAQEAWDNVTRSRSRWTLIRTKRYYQWLGQGGTFLATVPSDRVVAIHRRGHWFVRVGEPWTPDADRTLVESGHGPVEIAVNFGRKMHEAAMLGPIDHIAPGETTNYRERWYIIPGMASRTRQLDAELHKIDPQRFPLPAYLDDEEDEELDRWLDEADAEMIDEGAEPSEQAPPTRDAHEPPPIDIDAVEEN